MMSFTIYVINKNFYDKSLSCAVSLKNLCTTVEHDQEFVKLEGGGIPP